MNKCLIKVTSVNKYLPPPHFKLLQSFANRSPIYKNQLKSNILNVTTNSNLPVDVIQPSF